ncbi:MAG: hypothetical protein M4D80_21660 [Myxococcota bacterium]|nr:hypothetical protein [Deltaproteobacteria bacterium]MDQ3337776.1 hypothetical protein [Myxococcota bacterium]
MRTAATLVLAPWIATALVWLVFSACMDIDSPMPDEPLIARVIVVWDPLACGDPHRVAVELEDQAGVKLSSSTPCNAGSLTIDARHFGVYYGRIYAWEAGEPIRSITTVRLFVDEPVMRWLIATPP